MVKTIGFGSGMYKMLTGVYITKVLQFDEEFVYYDRISITRSRPHKIDLKTSVSTRTTSCMK